MGNMSQVNPYSLSCQLAILEDCDVNTLTKFVIVLVGWVDISVAAVFNKISPLTID